MPDRPPALHDRSPVVPDPSPLPLRALALDIDGTLLDPTHRIPAPVADALHQARRRGLEVYLASGRHLGSLAGIARALGIDTWGVGFAGAGGARLRADGSFDVLFHHTLPTAFAHELLGVAGALGLGATWYGADAWYATSAEGWFRNEAAILGQPPVLVADLRALDWSPSKLQLIGHGDGGRARLLALADALDGHAYCTMSYSHSSILEVMAPGVSKANGLRALGAITGVGLDRLVAFGDADNDLEMLRAAAVGVAMGNAADHVRAAADWVTASNEAHGVAVALAQDWLWRRIQGLPGGEPPAAPGGAAADGDRVPPAPAAPDRRTP